MNRKYLLTIILMALMVIGSFFFARGLWVPMKQKIFGKKTTNEIVNLYGPRVRDELIPFFKQNSISYPPKELTFLALKNEQRLEIWTKDSNNKNIFIRSYSIWKLSGKTGPKLREGDYQVPEGIYKIIGLNPNSSYHLSMKLNYPNEFDLAHAKTEGRTKPGSNIFIHGKAVSIGCLAMGDKTIEELFILAKDVGIKNISVVISPYDPRIKELKYIEKEQPKWTKDLYKDISIEFSKYNKT